MVLFVIDFYANELGLSFLCKMMFLSVHKNYPGIGTIRDICVSSGGL